MPSMSFKAVIASSWSWSTAEPLLLKPRSQLRHEQNDYGDQREATSTILVCDFVVNFAYIQSFSSMSARRNFSRMTYAPLHLRPSSSCEAACDCFPFDDLYSTSIVVARLNTTNKQTLKQLGLYRPIHRGALKMLDVKITNVKLADQFAGHEIAGRENDAPNDRTWNCGTWNHRT